jgi:hypothetical protein
MDAFIARKNEKQEPVRVFRSLDSAMGRWTVTPIELVWMVGEFGGRQAGQRR